MPRKTKYTKEILEPLVRQSESVANVIKLLGLKLTGGNYQMIKARIQVFNIDTSHFTGMGHLKGKTHTFNARPDEEFFAKNTIFHNNVYRNRLLKLGWSYCCKICSLTEWLDKSITLHIDHINGDRTDNRLENLRFLCPNCHQQTDTWGSKKGEIDE